MNTLELLADEIDGCLYAAVVRKGVLIDLYQDGVDRAARWGSIYHGKITKFDMRLDAAFIDLGAGLTGFLAAEGAALQSGQMLPVQVKSEGKINSAHENQKLPRLTLKLALDGWFNVDDGAEFLHESAYLRQRLQKTLEAQPEAPRLLTAGPNAMFRALADYGVLRFEHIYVGNRHLLDQMMEACKNHFPALAQSKRLRLFKPEKPGQRLFDIYDTDADIEALNEASVAIDGEGANLIVETTSTLTVIDVNQGGAGNALNVNRAAAVEALRQCRLRNLSGVILIDFINTGSKTERAQLVALLKGLVEEDCGRAQFHGFTRLGIAEITRKRRSASFAEMSKKTSAIP